MRLLWQDRARGPRDGVSQGSSATGRVAASLWEPPWLRRCLPFSSALTCRVSQQRLPGRPVGTWGGRSASTTFLANTALLGGRGVVPKSNQSQESQRTSGGAGEVPRLPGSPGQGGSEGEPGPGVGVGRGGRPGVSPPQASQGGLWIWGGVSRPDGDTAGVQCSRGPPFCACSPSPSTHKRLGFPSPPDFLSACSHLPSSMQFPADS